MMDFWDVVLFIVTALFWGVTNPLLKEGSHSVEKVKGDNRLKQILMEVVFLIKNWTYTVPLIANQLGSALFFFCLTRTELSLAVPVVNSLTFIFTTITGYYLGESLSRKTVFGASLVTVGAILCVLSSVQQ